jgi:prepilin-type N-terminal cleavage/methylation domain-containing protein
MKPNRKRGGKTGSSGFTLIELMVSLSVLVILGLLVAQIMIAASGSTKISSRQVDAASQARLVFDRIGLDLEALVKRPDADFQMGHGASGAPVLEFLSQVASADPAPLPAGFANRGISLVRYAMRKMADNAGRLCLVRAGKAVGWNMPGFVGYKNTGTAGNPEYLFPVSFRDAGYPVTIEDSDEDILSPAALQIVVGVQLYPDNAPVYSQGASLPSVANARGQVVYQIPMREASPGAGNGYADLERIASLVVGVVVVDLESLKLLDTAQVDALSAAFQALPQDGDLPLDAWMAASQDLSHLPSTLPPPARQAVRLYQRIYPINPYGSRK